MTLKWASLAAEYIAIAQMERRSHPVMKRRVAKVRFGNDPLARFIKPSFNCSCSTSRRHLAICLDCGQRLLVGRSTSAAPKKAKSTHVPVALFNLFNLFNLKLFTLILS